MRYSGESSDITPEQRCHRLGQEPHPEDKAHQALRHQCSHHGQTQRTDHQLADALEQVNKHHEPGRGEPLLIGKPPAGSRGGQETERAEEHPEGKFERHGEITPLAAHPGIDHRQHRATHYHPEGVERLEADRVDVHAQHLVMHVVDGKEVQ